MNNHKNSKNIKLSIVTTLYNSYYFIDEFYKRIIQSAENLNLKFEIVFVNDGSPDNSLIKIKEYLFDPRIKIINLSRNFGHHQAFMAGLQHAQGEFIFLIDIDLEEQPEWLIDFYNEIKKTESDLIYGIQEVRSGSIRKVITGNIFYKTFNLISTIQIPPNACTVRIMTKKYKNALLRLKDRNLFLAGNYIWVGFKQNYKLVQKTPRKTKSNYNILKTTNLFVNAITSFSNYPLKIIFTMGLFISTTSFSFGIKILIDKIIHPNSILLGWSSLMISIWFIGGVIVFTLGLIGIYISQIFDEVKHRPPYIVSDIFPSE